MQLRRVLLLFALVLGLSAVVASIAPVPEERADTDGQADKPTRTTPAAAPLPGTGTERVRFGAPDPDDASFETPTRLVPAGSSLSVTVSVPEPGDVVLDGLGLRQSADPLAPARFSLLAEPEGRFSVLYLPLDGDPRLVGRLQFDG